MTYPADHTPSQRIKSTKPSSHTPADSADLHQPSEADRSFIRSMNEFVKKHGTITDDEFFRVL
ncbi:hypothetical protein [Enterobacter asburiae]|uniref:hypothetical protein n=1 Tax=Enterobacter asburiae TaxID=61645 RepID=UPI0011D20DCD|nr:hypothetical protein [Enterobacter asburiae]